MARKLFLSDRSDMNKFAIKIIKFLWGLLPHSLKSKVHNHLSAKFRTPDQTMFDHLRNLRELGYNPAYVIDVGAYIGEWTLHAKNIFPDATFLMIEPQFSKVEVLNKITKENANTLFANALIGKENRSNVVFYEMETGSSIYEELTSYGRTLVYYEMTTLDHLIAKYKLEGEIFLKLDVQGSEIDILKGSKKALENISFILLEASLLDYNNGAPLLADVMRYMDEIGFALFDICDQRRVEGSILFQVDLLFTKKRSAIREKVNYYAS